jgi:Integrase core domain/Chromo (CHRromatin Organisation MOdifier) domain
MEQLLKNIYYDPVQGFCGEDELLRRVRLVYPKENKLKIKKWLASQPTHTIHTPSRKNYLRNKVLVSGIDEQWQADLVDLQSLAKFNEGYKYILTCIDIFSKSAWAIPLLSKTSENVRAAFAQIFSSGRIPYKLQTDAGTEFVNKEVQKYLKSYDIHFFITNSEKKASVVERFNRTLKEKMWKYFTKQNTYNYVSVLSALLTNYNTSFHRTIGMAPCEVNAKNETEILNRVFRVSSPIKHFKFNIDDAVRISKVKRHFEKGYTPNWSEEYFFVDERIMRDRPVYKLKDQMHEKVDGVFYEPELQKIRISKDDLHVVEKILKTRKKNKHTEYFVKWRGYPDKFNSWTSDIIKI